MNEHTQAPLRDSVERELWLALLAAAIVVPGAALALYLGGPSIVLALLLLAELLLLLVCWRLRDAQRRARLRLQALKQDLISQRVTDSSSGAALPDWFDKVLRNECRRAVREFSPLALMQLELSGTEPAQRAQAAVSLARMLTRELSRPGDLVGLTEQGSLQVLMPATNEQCRQLAQRCLQQAQTLLADQAVEVRVGVCVMQPLADLTADKVRQHLLIVMARLRDQPPGSIDFDAEPTVNSIPSPTYSL